MDEKDNRLVTSNAPIHKTRLRLKGEIMRHQIIIKTGGDIKKYAVAIVKNFTAAEAKLLYREIQSLLIDCRQSEK